jgi:type VI secretion system protein VasJ
MSPTELSQVLELGSNPIPGDAPTGADVSTDADYLSVMSELVKADRIDTTDPPDWQVLEQSAVNVLREKSKDVEIAAALGHALFQRYTYAGLAAALGMLTNLVETFWENCYPPRARRRKARIEALGSRFTDHGWFRDHPPQGADFDAIDVCVGNAESLSRALKQRMPDDPPELDKFLRGLKELAAKRPRPVGATPTGASPSGPGSAVGDIGDTKSALGSILSACTFLRKADSADPIPYAIVRILKWSTLSLPASEAGKVQIEPPEASAVDALAHQQKNALWEHLLNGAEAAFRSGDPLWLDVQRYVCVAMARLGVKFDPAREVVMGLTALLFRRLGEGMFDLRFRNGTPLCSGETRMWLENELASNRGGQSAPAGGATSNGKLQEASVEARKLVGAGKLKEALQVLQQGLVGCTQRRDRFLWRLGMAQLCFDAQCLQLAAPLLEECYEEIQHYQIEEWEPTLAVALAQTLYRCRKSLTLKEKTPPPEALQRVRESFASLCRLDPLAALVTEPSSGS